MPLRRTKGIVTDRDDSDPISEADVIMTAAALGFAADFIVTKKQPLQFDIDPLGNTDDWIALFNATVGKIDKAVDAYLKKNNLFHEKVHAGVCPGYHPGAAIVGVYELAGQQTPKRDLTGPNAPLAAPRLSAKGKALWEAIATVSPEAPQYTGRGAYTGFVDNLNTEGDTDPVGPRSTVRMVAPAPGVPAPTEPPFPRWLPPDGHPLWNDRRRKGKDTYIPWGLIGGNDAGKDPKPQPHPDGVTNLADQIESEMSRKYGMVFTCEPALTDIATYTHGMIQAIYKAYALGPSCVPYEIAVGDQTKKMASCLPCTLFMQATGYPPTSIHLGSGESWAPLYAPYNPNGPTTAHEHAVIRDLNNAWSAECLKWLKLGLEVLGDAQIATGHKASRDAVRAYLTLHDAEPTLGAVLILDALTIHTPEMIRIGRTLQ